MATLSSVLNFSSACLLTLAVAMTPFQSTQTNQSSQTTTTQQSGSGRATATASSSGSSGGNASASGWDIPPGMKTFSVVYSPGPNWVRGKRLMEQVIQPHVDYQRMLLMKGHLLIGGPYVDVDGGQSVLIARSMEEAENMVSGDPAVQSGLMVPELHEWQIVLRRGAPMINR